MSHGKFLSFADCATLKTEPMTWEKLREAYDELREIGRRYEAVAAEREMLLSPVYDAPTARRMLGNISHTTLWQEILLGNLERVPGTRRCLVTRESVLAWPETKRRRAAEERAKALLG